MWVASIYSNLPQFSRLALGLAEGKAQVSSVWRPAQPKSQPLSGDEPMGLAAVSSDDRQIVSAGNEQVLAVGHPGGIVGKNIRHTAGIAAEGGNNPKRLLRF